MLHLARTPTYSRHVFHLVVVWLQSKTPALYAQRRPRFLPYAESWLVVGDYCEERISLQVLVDVLARPYLTQSFTLRLAVSTFNIREGATGKGNCTVVLYQYTAKSCWTCVDDQWCCYVNIKVGSTCILDKKDLSEDNAASCSNAHTQSASFLVRRLRGSLMMMKSLMNREMSFIIPRKLLSVNTFDGGGNSFNCCTFLGSGDTPVLLNIIP